MGKPIEMTSAAETRPSAGSNAVFGRDAIKLRAREWDGGLKRRTVLDQVIGAAFVFVPIAGTILLTASWQTLHPTVWDVAIAMGLYLGTGLGVTAGSSTSLPLRAFTTTRMRCPPSG